MKITMYELLGMVKDGKEPKKFKYDGSVWTYNYESSAYWNEKDVEFEDYMSNSLLSYLNDEVEIVEEEKMPEKIKINDKPISKVELAQKYNELIDYLQSKGD